MGEAMEYGLAGRTLVVTGAARGQGAAEAELLVGEGARVIGADILDDGTSVAMHSSTECCGVTNTTGLLMISLTRVSFEDRPLSTILRA